MAKMCCEVVAAIFHFTSLSLPIPPGKLPILSQNGMYDTVTHHHNTL